MVMNPYRSDTRQLAQYGEEDDTNAPDTGAPPRPEPYRPATQQPAQRRNEQAQRPPTFSQMQDLGEARPPMPPQNPQVSPIQPYMANTVDNPAGPNSTGQGLGANPNQPQNQPQGAPAPTANTVGPTPFVQQGLNTLAANPNAPQGWTPGNQTAQGDNYARGTNWQINGGTGNQQAAEHDRYQAYLTAVRNDASPEEQQRLWNAIRNSGPAAPQGAPAGVTQAPAPQNILTPDDQEILNGQGGQGGGGGQLPTTPQGGPVFTPNGPTTVPTPADPTPTPTNGGPAFNPNTGGPSSPNVPAPGTPNAPTGTSPTGGNGFLQDLLPMLFAGANRQNPYGTQQLQDSYNWLGGQIDDQYDVRRQELGEEMARRGLGASTIYGGRLNDLNIGQRTARENLGYDLTQRQASGESQAGRDRLDYIRSLIGYGQQGFENDMSTAEFDRRSNNDYEEFIRWLMGQGG